MAEIVGRRVRKMGLPLGCCSYSVSDVRRGWKKGRVGRSKLDTDPDARNPCEPWPRILSMRWVRRSVAIPGKNTSPVPSG